MSPKPVPITTGKRPATVHWLTSGGRLALCGRSRWNKAVVWPAGPGLPGQEGAVSCVPCLRNGNHLLWKHERRTYELQELAAHREQRAKTAYEVWAHRGVYGTPDAFEQLPENRRQAWREVIEYFEKEFLEEDDVSR